MIAAIYARKSTEQNSVSDEEKSVTCQMDKTRRSEADVLRYSTRKIHRETVRRFYIAWRRRHGLPERCDDPECRYYTSPLEWNGQALPLNLDHVNGNSKDNSPENLRLMCPNCDSQLPTRGGKNKGRVQNASDDGYQIAHRDGRRDGKAFLRGQSTTGLAGDVGVPTADGEAASREFRKDRGQEEG